MRTHHVDDKEKRERTRARESIGTKVGEIRVARMRRLQSFMSGRQKFVVVIVKLNRIATCFAIILLFRFSAQQVRGKERAAHRFPCHGSLWDTHKLHPTRQMRKKAISI